MALSTTIMELCFSLLTVTLAIIGIFVALRQGRRNTYSVTTPAASTSDSELGLLPSSSAHTSPSADPHRDSFSVSQSNAQAEADEERRLLPSPTQSDQNNRNVALNTPPQLDTTAERGDRQHLHEAIGSTLEVFSRVLRSGRD